MEESADANEARERERVRVGKGETVGYAQC